MSDLHYHRITDATLEHCFDQLDSAYEAEMLEELALEDGILTIITASGRTFLLNKHAPSGELWLASPVSGGLHFRFDQDAQRWTLPDGRLLYDLLHAELAAEGVEVVL